MKPSEKRKLKQQRDQVEKELLKVEKRIKEETNGFIKKKLEEKAKDLRETKKLCEMYVGK